MAKYTFYKYTNNTASVVKVATNTSAIVEHTLVTIDPTTFAVTEKDDTPTAGDFLVWRPYPNYAVPGDRYGRISKTPIATGVGELYGFRLKDGDQLLNASGELIIVSNPILKVKEEA